MLCISEAKSARNLKRFSWFYLSTLSKHCQLQARVEVELDLEWFEAFHVAENTGLHLNRVVRWMYLKVLSTYNDQLPIC